MASPVITFTRQFASGGSDIARLVARALEWDVIDNEFVDTVARRAGLPIEEVAQRGAGARPARARRAHARRRVAPRCSITSASAPSVEIDEATIVKVTERVIAEAAALGRVVLVGRGAQHYSRSAPDALHVYVVASRPWRMKLAVNDSAPTPRTLGRSWMRPIATATTT